MKLFITGGTGFIGTHLLSLLEKCDVEILALTRHIDVNLSQRNTQWIKGDLGTTQWQSEVKTFNPDSLIHLSWQGIPDFTAPTSQNNLFQSLQLFDFMLDQTDCKKILASGSCFEYGQSFGACEESVPPQRLNYFTWAKQSSQQYLQVRCDAKDVLWGWMRIFYVYGPGQRKASLIPSVIEQLKQKQLPNIRTPHNQNDFVYVGDVAQAFAEAALQQMPSGIYNLGSGTAEKILDVMRTTEALMYHSSALTSQLEQQAKTDVGSNFYANTNKSKTTLGWSAKTSLKTGIEQTIQSMENET